MNNKQREQLAADLLDAALAKYCEVEPRAGLEERVLVNLQTQRLTVRWFWWQWGPVLASATVIVVVLFTVSLTKRSTNSTWVTANDAQEAETIKVNQLKAMVLTSGDTVAHGQAGNSEQSEGADIEVAHAKQIGARESVTASKREARKLNSAAAVITPQLIAQQAKARDTEGLRIEELQIAEVGLDEIVISKNEKNEQN